MTPASSRRTAAGTPSRIDTRGMALVVSLVLLVIVTLVATAGMTTSTLQLRMAAGEQAATGAFQVAENAIETAMHCRRPQPGEIVSSRECPPVPNAAAEQYEFAIRRSTAEEGSVLPEGYSLGTELTAIPFTIEASAAGSRGARAELAQGFQVMGLKE
jgi:type II secretory pathway pseudopilin PulG